MRRLITLSILAVVAPATSLVMLAVYLLVDVVHGYQRSRPIAPITRAQRKRFEAEGAAIQARCGLTWQVACDEIVATLRA